MQSENTLPLGKIPPELLSKLIARAPIEDERVILGPGIGLDCAVIDLGESLIVVKSDPITFATDEIGWYAVQVNTNDVATTGATPTWFMATVLLPENSTDEQSIVRISDQLFDACKENHISFIGGHTEITHGLDRPIISGILIGEVSREDLITPRGANVGDVLLLTKGVPIEATAILSREFPERLKGMLTAEEIQQAQNYLHQPGIGVLRDARIAIEAGKVTAMHDPTEGGILSALWELADASEKHIVCNPESIHIPRISRIICETFNLDPLATIASGALLMAVEAQSVNAVKSALADNQIHCSEIGVIEDGQKGLFSSDGKLLPRPLRDDITRVYENE